MTTIGFSSKALRLAQYFIAKGNPISFPTETVYALAADATSDKAVESIYALKKRDAQKPLSLLVRDAEQIRQLCDMNPKAEALLAAFAPGPLTLVLPLKKRHGLSERMNPGMDTIGVRIPDHPIAQTLLKSMSVPLVGTSANISGEKEAVCAEEVAAYLGSAVPFVIEGGTSREGRASTVVDLTGQTPIILRQGSLTKAQIDAVCQNQRNAI